MFQVQPAYPNINRSAATPFLLAHSFLTPAPFSFAIGASVGRLRVSLFFEASETRMPRLRNFDTEPRSPYCYEAIPDTRFESVANAHTAADLHVRPVLKPRWSESRGRRERYKKYTMGEFPQCVESRCAPSQRPCCSAGGLGLESKVLNRRIESGARGLVTNLATVTKILIISLRSIADRPIFRTAWPRYGDK
jgi:hypothetical protein